MTLNVATNETWKDDAGDKHEQTDWHRVAIFSKLGDLAEKHLKKGSKVYVEGKLRARKWEDKEGKTQHGYEIHITPYEGKLLFLDGKSADSTEVSSEDSTEQEAA